MCDVPSVAVFVGNQSIECCPGIVSRYFCKLLRTIPVAPMITGMTKHFINLAVLLDCKLYFHHHTDYTSFQGLKYWTWFIILPLLSPLLTPSLFCIPLLYDPNWNTHPLPGTPLYRWIRPNSKELKKNNLVCTVTYSGCSIHDGTLLHSKSQYTTVKHSQQLWEHTYASDPHGLGTLTPIEFFQQDLLWQSSNTHSNSCSQKAFKHTSGYRSACTPQQHLGV
jgi:hypothetical protein